MSTMSQKIPTRCVLGAFTTFHCSWDFIPGSETNQWSSEDLCLLLEADLMKSEVFKLRKRNTQDKSHWKIYHRGGTVACTFFFLIYLFFNWRIIAVQNFVVFCQTSTRISHRCTHVPLFPDLPPISLSIPPFSLSQSPCLSSLSHTANSHWLSILHMVL